MTTDTELGQLLVRQNLMSEAQLATALDFQKSLGGDLRNIVVKLGYVKDSVLAGLVAQEENVGAAEISEDVIDFAALKAISREVLEKHLVLPLRSDEPHTLVLAMSDPNDLRAIEEIQFLVNKSVEPAVTTKAAIRKALNQLPELLQRRREAKKAKQRTTLPPEVVRALRDTPVDKLIRAYLAIRIEQGDLSAEDLLARANKL